jgi:ribosomal protein L24E
MQKNYDKSSNKFCENKEQLDSALVRLISLKRRVFDLRVQCETLKKLKLEKQENLRCGVCGKLINQGQGVALHDSFGNAMRFFHKDCFKAIWQSQNWRFDYSSPGFFKLTGKDC